LKPRSFRITIDSNVEDAVVASSMIRGLLELLRIDRQDADAVELCATEALVNAVRHAFRNEAGHPVHLEFTLDADAIVLEVITPGRSTTRRRLEDAICAAAGFDPSDLDALSEGGRGMLIISQSVDEWDYFADGADGVLQIRKRLRPAKPQP
jgi:serine/threonine-protein kinase RsbW